MQVRFQRALGVCSLMLLSTLAAHGQSRIGQPIHPGYQGFVYNDDGSVTMVFQYFSHNRDPVTIPTGPENGFNGTADRNQPITFEPGNHEFVCLIIAENREAAARLRWSITFPENESATSIDPLNKEYQLTKRSETSANRDLDLATAERGVCLNRPPAVLISTGRRRNFAAPDGSDEADNTPTIDAKLSDEFTLNGSARDEGLPRGNSVTATWTQIGGTGTVTFANANLATTGASFSTAGVYEVELTATDGELANSARIKINVSDD